MFYKIQKNEHEGANFFSTKMTEIENLGVFGLTLSSHDAHDNMDFQKVVDVRPNYPSKQYLSAIYELVDRYLIPRIFTKKKESDHLVKGSVFNSVFLLFYHYAQENDMPFFIYLHPDRKEMQERKYDYQGDEIIKFCTDNNGDVPKGHFVVVSGKITFDYKHVANGKSLEKRLFRHPQNMKTNPVIAMEYI
jgi:hypothetical protein